MSGPSIQDYAKQFGTSLDAQKVHAVFDEYGDVQRVKGGDFVVVLPKGSELAKKFAHYAVDENGKRACSEKELEAFNKSMGDYHYPDMDIYKLKDGTVYMSIPKESVESAPQADLQKEWNIMLDYMGIPKKVASLDPAIKNLAMNAATDKFHAVTPEGNPDGHRVTGSVPESSVGRTA